MIFAIQQEMQNLKIAQIGDLFVYFRRVGSNLKYFIAYASNKRQDSKTNCRKIREGRMLTPVQLHGGVEYTVVHLSSFRGQVYKNKGIEIKILGYVNVSKFTAHV